MASFSRRSAIRIGLGGLSGALFSSTAFSAPQQIGILTGPVTGSYYSLGRVLANALTTQDCLISAISSNGAFLNVGHVGAQLADTALCQEPAPPGVPPGKAGFDATCALCHGA